MARHNKQDPTGQARNRKKGTRALQNRLTRAERQIKALFRAIPKERRRQAGIVNNVTFYDYDYPALEQERLATKVQGILDEELETTDAQMPPDWFWQDNLEQPYRQGTVETINSLNQQVTAAAIAGITARGVIPQTIPAESVLFSPAYAERLQSVYVTNYPTIKGLSQDTSKQIMQQINTGIKANQPPSVIAENISKRFDVSRSSAQRIADTEINKAFTDAELDATVIAADVTGLRAGVIHISALLPTTRDHHAARHGNAYTVEQQRQWWDTGSNRINCHCSVTSVLIDSSGKLVDTKKQQSIKAERSFFDVQVPIEPPKTAKKAISTIEKSKPKKKITKLKKSTKPTKVIDQKIDKTDVPPKFRKIQLTGDESAYVEYYKGEGFYKNNQILRNPNAYTSNELGSAVKMRDSINTAIDKSPFLSDGTLYRGIKSDQIFDNAEKLIGKSIPINTAQSTATNAGSSTGWAGLIRTKSGNFVSANKGQSVVLKIRTKKGQHGLNMESLSIGNTAEKEILLKSGGSYKVKTVRALKDDQGNITGKVIEVDYNE